MEINKSFHKCITATLFIVGGVALYQIVEYLSKLLNLLVELIKRTDASPEFNIILILVSIFITCQVFELITKLIFKMYSLLKVKYRIENGIRNKQRSQ